MLVTASAFLFGGASSPFLVPLVGCLPYLPALVFAPVSDATSDIYTYDNPTIYSGLRLSDFYLQGKTWE
jgi:hypothetical protein